MRARLAFRIQPQPDETTCGPTCLQAVYDYYGDAMDLTRVIGETRALEGGGTLGVFLANHALQRGYRATIYTYNLQIFDPTWFAPGAPPIVEKLRSQLREKSDERIQLAGPEYIRYLERGGRLRFVDLTRRLIRRHLDRGVPILTGLSATYLYHGARELPDSTPDDVRGRPVGHFVVLCGYDRHSRQVLVADPYVPNPYSSNQLYEVDMERVLGSILLGILTYDANLVLIERAPGAPEAPCNP